MTHSSLAIAAHYYSTHCLHEHHDECKRVCKHCPAECRCDCHSGDSPSDNASATRHDVNEAEPGGTTP